MSSYVRRCIFFACMTAVSVPLGLYVNNNAYIVTFFCFGWFVYYLVKWLSGEPPKKKKTFKETFEQFYGGPKDDSDQSSREG